MANRYSYPVDLHEEPEGGFSVTFPDFDEAFTDGDSFAEAISEAADCLEEALAGRILRRDDIPAPSPAKGRPTAVPGATLAAKTALCEALREERLSISAFRRFHGCPRTRGAPNARSRPRNENRPVGGSVGPIWQALGGIRGGSRLWSLPIEMSTAGRDLTGHCQLPTGQVIDSALIDHGNQIFCTCWTVW